MSAEARTPSLTWQGAESIQLLCLVAPATLPERGTLQSALCETLRDVVAGRSELPVRVLEFGDPALIEPGSASLLLHANVQEVERERLLVFHIRSFRPGRLESETFFAAAPRAIQFTNTRNSMPSIRAEMISALQDILP